MQRVKIFNENEGSLGTRCFVGEHELHGVKEIDYHVSVDEYPTFHIEMHGCPDIDVLGDVIVKFHPNSLVDACRVLQRAYKEDEVFRKRLIKLCNDAIGDIYGDCGHIDTAKYLANYIMEFINGY